MNLKTPIRGYTGTHALHFNDEAKRIGSGRRLVNIKVGSKWVSLRCPSTGGSARMTRNQFMDIWQGTARRIARTARAKGGAKARRR